MRRRRPGYTFVEIMVVLAIIIVVAGFSLASISMMFSDQSTENSSDLVRQKWAEARSKSIREGTPYVFGVVWNENVWRVAPEGPDYWESGATDDNKVDTGAIADNVRFVEEDSPNLTFPLSPSPVPKSIPADQFTQLVTFNPDGSIVPIASPDGTVPEIMHVHMEGVTNSRVAVSLRALTGVTTRTWKHPGQSQGKGNDNDADDRR